MKPSSRGELLRILEGMGQVAVGSLFTRITGSYSEFFEEFDELKRNGFIEIHGDEKEVKYLIDKAISLETDETLDVDMVQNEIYSELDNRMAAADSIVLLSKNGFTKAQKY